MLTPTLYLGLERDGSGCICIVDPTRAGAVCFGRLVCLQLMSL